MTDASTDLDLALARVAAAAESVDAVAGPIDGATARGIVVVPIAYLANLRATLEALGRARREFLRARKESV